MEYKGSMTSSRPWASWTSWERPHCSDRVLITLDSLSISITPLLTTLGISRAAVALAFKDTLANFFAGLYILADRPIRGGDYIKLEGGPEGYVESVGWRSTRVRTLANNIVVIPNSRLAESIITNYFLPDRRFALTLNISVSRDSDSRKVERILLEEAREGASKIEGMLEDPPPSVSFIPGFRESSLDFSVNAQVREFVYQYGVQHELRHRILERFRKEGIEMPFPQRTVHFAPGKGLIFIFRPGGYVRIILDPSSSSLLRSREECVEKSSCIDDDISLSGCTRKNLQE
jgi:small-conductance mechanosensitive channel